MWLGTGDERYARNVVTLLDAWATTCKSFVGELATVRSQRRPCTRARL